MGILTQKVIWDEMLNPDDTDDPLMIMPLLEESQVGASSVDVRLGHQFIILQRASLTHIDPTDRANLETEIQRSQHRVRVSLHQQFIIHPGQLVLGATLEYISIPRTLAATVEGRSSWGRLGLIIATASSIAPGFKGCVTLELVNEGEAPLVLYPGIKIAQLIFQRTEEQASYREGEASTTAMPSDEEDQEIAKRPKYDCAIGPQFTRIHRDETMSFWGQKDLT